ncbi:MAG: hypothetical protein Ct9H300mP4_14390 [Gammaproteobacteria bacterium]|nr:MAG: hypothetical protein Ct9H300mP4_14390 [Gammaproteobacteria bacterium]
MRTIGMTGQTVERMKRQQDWGHAFDLKTKIAEGVHVMESNGVSRGLAGQINTPAPTYFTVRAFLCQKEVWASVPGGDQRHQMAKPFACWEGVCTSCEFR